MFEAPRPGRAVWTLRTDLQTGHVTVRSPALRPRIADITDPDDGSGSLLIEIDPSGSMPPALLSLTPASS